MKFFVRYETVWFYLILSDFFLLFFYALGYKINNFENGLFCFCFLLFVMFKISISFILLFDDSIFVINRCQYFLCCYLFICLFVCRKKAEVAMEGQFLVRQIYDDEITYNLIGAAVEILSKCFPYCHLIRIFKINNFYV